MLSDAMEIKISQKLKKNISHVHCTENINIVRCNGNKDFPKTKNIYNSHINDM